MCVTDWFFFFFFHTINDIELIPLELVNSDRDSIRKAREGFLISLKAKHFYPMGWICLRRRHSKPYVDSVRLYKRFRRVCGPAATQVVG